MFRKLFIASSLLCLSSVAFANLPSVFNYKISQLMDCDTAAPAATFCPCLTDEYVNGCKAQKSPPIPCNAHAIFTEIKNNSGGGDYHWVCWQGCQHDPDPTTCENTCVLDDKTFFNDNCPY